MASTQAFRLTDRRPLTLMSIVKHRGHDWDVLHARRVKNSDALGIAVHGIGMSHLAFFEQLGESSWSTVSASPTVASGQRRRYRARHRLGGFTQTADPPTRRSALASRAKSRREQLQQILVSEAAVRASFG
jgi:hypothetical protein